MKHKTMTDYQRVKAGTWIENQKAWIATMPSYRMIARQAEKELDHKVTDWFVKNYLSETDWFLKMKQNRERVPTPDIETAVALTLEVLEKIMANAPINPDEIQYTIRKAKGMITTTETEHLEPFDGQIMLTENA
tara:strand:+ start:371 stop:772 length:402 start_codon:yes stop_codon:yes gene_type:complete